MKTCSKCKQEQPKTEFNIHKRMKDGLQAHCKTCLQAYGKTDAYKASIKRYQQHTWRGMASVIRNHMRSNSLKRGHFWDDSWWSIESILEKIEHKNCNVTKIPFELRVEEKQHKKRAFVPSPDRIDNSKGYEPDNVQWVVFIYNLMKNSFDDADVAHFLLFFKDYKDSNDSGEDYDV